MAIEGDLSKLDNPIDPPDLFDPKSSDPSFADSLFDFDSIEEWFKDIHAPTTTPDVGSFDFRGFDMADQAFVEVLVENPEKVGALIGVSVESEDGSGDKVLAENPENVGALIGVAVESEDGSCEKVPSESLVAGSELVVGGSVSGAELNNNLGELSCCIVKDFGKVSLARDPESCDFVAPIQIKTETVCIGVEDNGKASVSEAMASSSSEESSSEESESSSSSSSEESDSDDDDDDQVKEKVVMKVDAEVEEGEILEADGKQVVSREDDDEDDDDADDMVIWNDVDEEDEGGGAAKPIRSKNELADLPPVPPVDVELQPNHQLLPVGVVLSVIGAKVIVEGVEKHKPLCEGSILWITEKRSPLGLIDEIFGPVKNPYYVVRYNSESEVPDGLQDGSLIAFVPEFANHVLNDKSLYKKGYDASGDNDEEMSDEAEFSDDEKEAEHKRMQKMSKRGMTDQNLANGIKNKKKGTNNRDRQWKHNMPEIQQPTMGNSRLPPNKNWHHKPPHDGNSSSISIGQDLAGGHGTVHSFPQNAPAGAAGSVPSFPQNGLAGGAGTLPSFPQNGPAGGFPPIPNGPWNNRMQYQQAQGGGVFPGGFPAQGMQWMLPNFLQNHYQMPMPMQFQQQFDPNQMPLTFPPGCQPSFAPGSAPAPWAGFGCQNNFNQMAGMSSQGQQLPPGQATIPNGMHFNQTAGMGSQDQQLHPGQATMPNGMHFNQTAGMGSQGQQLPPGQATMPNRMQMEHNSNFQPPTGNVEAPQQFNQGASHGRGHGRGRGRGRRQYQRGGGRYGGGRGRQQSR